MNVTTPTKVDSKIGSVLAIKGNWIISEFSKDKYMLKGYSFGVKQGDEAINIPNELSKKSPGLYVFQGTQFIIRGQNSLEPTLAANKSLNHTSILISSAENIAVVFSKTGSAFLVYFHFLISSPFFRRVCRALASALI